MNSTVTRSYDSYANAKTVVSELKSAGFDDGDISLVAHKDAESHVNGASTGAGLGAVAGGTVGLLTGIGIMAIPGVGPVVAAGWLVATAVGAVAGGAAGAATGGIIDALVHSGVSKLDAHVYGETVRRGGTLVSVQTDSDVRRATAMDMMDRAHPIDIASRRTAYESEGWKAFDPESKPYTSDETEAERRRYL